MPEYIIETTYHLPVYRQRTYQAETVDEACRLAVENEGWDNERSDGDTSGETYVTGIWQDAERAYEGTARPVPEAFHEMVQRKVELFGRLQELVRERTRPMGLSGKSLRTGCPRPSRRSKRPMRYRKAGE